MWGAVAGAALGGLAGAQGDKSSVNSVSGIRVAPETELEKQATKSLQGGLGGFESVVNAGPGAQAATDYMSASGSLQEMLKKYAAGGFMPGQEDFATAGKYAADVFKPQQVMQQQQFEQQSQQAQRLAAQLNRPVNDPIIQAKMRQEQMRQADVLGAQQSSYGAQFAQQLPQQRLSYTQQLADVTGNLASQAMSNRQALLSLGSTLREQDRSYRIATGERYGSQEGSSGGGLKGALTGAIGGAGAGLSAMSAMQSMDQSQGMYKNFMDNGGFKQAAQAATQQSPVSSFFQQANPYAGQSVAQGVPSFLNPQTAYASPLAATQGNYPISTGKYNFMQGFGAK